MTYYDPTQPDVAQAGPADGSGGAPAPQYGQAPQYAPAPQYGQTPQYPAGPAAYPPAPSGPYYATPAASGPARVWPRAFVGLAVLGLIGFLLPWFHPSIGGQTDSSVPAVHSWNGVVFFFAPIGMIVCAIGAIAGPKMPARFRSVTTNAIITGVLLIVTLVAHWLQVPSHYSDWNEVEQFAKSEGLTLSYGPQFGFWLTAVVAVLYLGLGIYGARTLKRAA